MKVLILTGGTGSIALQRGLYGTLETATDGVEVKILVNAYDNGLSTGAVRKVMDGEILGPSDVRKNQTTRLQLQFPDSPWLSLLNYRFSVASCGARDICERKVVELAREFEEQLCPTDSCKTLQCAIDEYFKSPRASKIEYIDFSLANVIYAGLARANGNSLRTAASIMSGAMNIPDNVLVNDDRSLFLGAVTRTGQRIADEGRIVSWGNDADPFVDVYFNDAHGREAKPALCFEAWRAIVQADLIILSSGTQWSSLIPTYASDGFTAAIRESRAKIVMVMNRTPDRDSPGQTASDIIDVLVPRYFDVGRLHVVADKNGHPTMRNLSRSSVANVGSFTQSELSTPTDPQDKHSPDKLADAISRVFFKDYLDSDFYLFDYDDTLVGRKKRCPRSSSYNVRGISRLNWLTSVGICSGNTIRAIELKGEPAALSEDAEPIYKPLLVFADGGINRYLYDTRPTAGDSAVQLEPACCISPENLLPGEGPHSAARIVGRLQQAAVPYETIDNRGNALIAIKPVAQDDRLALIALIGHIVGGSNLQVRECGRTTVEICRTTLTKSCVLRYLRDRYPTLMKITCIGDEFDTGNDRDIKEMAAEGTGVLCLHVDGPAKTAFFIKTLIACLGKDV